ncbi:UNVERIFIED_CONTAM: hypothetical protein FKN15_014655 [Acipenser sinensis]
MVVRKYPMHYNIALIINYLGHCISVGALIVAFVLFLCLRSIRCLRNIIHWNLITTFILRNVMWFLLQMIDHNIHESNEVTWFIFATTVLDPLKPINIYECKGCVKIEKTETFTASLEGPLSDWVRHHYSNAKNGFLVVFSPEKAEKPIQLPNGNDRSRDKSEKKKKKKKAYLMNSHTCYQVSDNGSVASKQAGWLNQRIENTDICRAFFEML